MASALSLRPFPPDSFHCNPKGPGSSCRDDAPFPQSVFLASAPPPPHLFPIIPNDTGSRHSHGTSSTSAFSNELPTKWSCGLQVDILLPLLLVLISQAVPLCPIVPVVSQFVHHSNVRFRYISTSTTLYYLTAPSSRTIFAALHRRFAHKFFVPSSYSSQTGKPGPIPQLCSYQQI